MSVAASESRGLSARAAEVAVGLPHLVAEAAKAAAAVHHGFRGQRRKGAGDEFWQLREARDGDHFRQIDWRRSARSEVPFVRETERKAAGTVLFWVDRSASMAFRSGERGAKADRARVIALALSMLLSRADELFGLVNGASPGTGPARVERLAAELVPGEDSEYGVPPRIAGPRNAIVCLSDFLGPWNAIRDSVEFASGAGAAGVLLQIFDPAEEAFPFRGRTEFRSMNGTLRFETLGAKSLKAGYVAELEKRKSAVAALARDAGWLSTVHGTGRPASPALLWLHEALSRKR